MYDSFVNTLEFFPRGLVYVGLGIIVLVVAKLILDVVTPYRINRQLADKNNSALGLSIAGYFMGVIIVFAGVLYQPLSIVRDDQWQWTGDFWLDVLEVAVYSLAGIVLLNLSRLFVDRLVLYQFKTEKEIIEDQNMGAAAVEFGVYVSAALVIAAATTGSTGGIEGVSDVSVVESALRS